MRVVVTGIGLINPLGGSTAAVLSAWQQGKTAQTRTLPVLAGTPLANRQVFQTEVPSVPGRKLAKYCSVVGALTLNAAQEAAQQAKLERYEGSQIGIFSAAGLTEAAWDNVVPLIENSLNPQGNLDIQRLATTGLDACHPLLSFRLLPNMPTCLVAMHLGLRGPNAVFTPWEEQASEALSAAWRAVSEGRCQVCLCGGADHAAHPMTLLYLIRAGLLNAADIPASGAAWLVLESEERALKDGLPILAVLPECPEKISDDFLRPYLGRLFAAAPATALAISLGSPSCTRPVVAKPHHPGKHRVAITGLGAVSAFGLGASTLWNNVAQGHCGIRPITRFDASSFAVRRAGECPNFDICCLPSSLQSLAKRDPKIAFAWFAVSEALSQANIKNFDQNTLLQLGASLETFDLTGTIHAGKADLAATVRAVLAGAAPLQIPLDAMANAIIETFESPGLTLTDCSACTAAAQAIGQAFHAVRDGRAQVAVCGGADSLITPLAIGGFHLLGALSTKDEDFPCRPFDQDRSGTTLGEGAGILVLESWENAEKRGAKILGEILGYGSSLDATHPSAPDPAGLGAQAAMRAALSDADVKPEHIGQCLAHGTGTLKNDEAEAQAIRSVFPHWQQMPVSASKAATGHTIAAAGALQAILAISSLNDGRLMPTLGLRNVAPGCELRHILQAGQSHDGQYALANTFGFGGQNASIVYGRGR